MAKLKPDAIGTPDLLEYLNSYSDFSFELTVLKMLRESGLECEHGGLYEDPVTGKSREFDIRAIKTIGKCRVRLAIECKNIRENFPILISCIPRHPQESYHQVALVSTPKSDSRLFAVNLHQSRAQTLSIRGDHSIYKPQQPVGKSIAQVGRALDGNVSANDAELYEKWGQSLSSATDLVQRTYWDGDDDDEASYLSMVIPFVIVPDDCLWSVSYDNNGNRVSDPSLTHRCSCFINKDYEMGDKLAGTTMWLTHVEIVTESGMASFISSYLNTKEGIANLFPKDGMIEAYKRALEAQT